MSGWGIWKNNNWLSAISYQLSAESRKLTAESSIHMQRHYHFIGIGGIGMGTLASLILAKGHRVSGSDVKENSMCLALKERGAEISIGHRPENVAGADYVVYSSAVRQDNLELAAARAKNIPVLRRAELLAELMNKHVGITVAGAHGKTTTTSMISTLLIRAGLNPTTAVGGIIKGAETHNANLGEGKYFVAEVDESDGSFLYFRPYYSVITNIDFEHVDYYQNWENILSAYKKFIQNTDPKGCVMICGDDPRLRQLVKEALRRYVTYGLSPECEFTAQNIRSQGCTTKFECVRQGKILGTIQILVPGQHNVKNALACVSVGLALGLEFRAIEESLLHYQGVNRRFQIKGRINDITIVDDYGHHPTEIAATLTAAKTLNKKRLIVAFQPHRYTRTKWLMDDFVKSLSLADYLIVTDIYAASEPALEGVSARQLYEKIKAAGHSHVFYLPKEDILGHLLRVIRSGDLVMTLGAGDINKISDDLVDAINRKNMPAVEKLATADLNPAGLGHIGVLMGGCSSEREISLKSGKAVYQALKAAGCRVSPIELNSTDEGQINALISQAKIDVAFIAMHGRFGEDGTLQAILEKMGMAYTGPGVEASRLAMNKISTQKLLSQNGITVPEFRILRGDRLPHEWVSDLKTSPVVVKPASEGSSVGISIVRNESDLSKAMEAAFHYGPEILVERFIEGREMTVGILDQRALPIVEIKPKSAFFDFTAKYQKGMTDYIVPAPLAADITEKIQATALKAFRIAGCRDFSRLDFILDRQGAPYLLEINTIPGFTETSLLPMAAQKAGMDFSQLCLTIVSLALARKTLSATVPTLSGRDSAPRNSAGCTRS